LYIYNAFGNLVKKELLRSSGTHRIDIAKLETGTNFCIVRDVEDQSIIEEKFLIQR
jgi:hypothetical protein